MSTILGNINEVYHNNANLHGTIKLPAAEVSVEIEYENRIQNNTTDHTFEGDGNYYERRLTAMVFPG